LLVSNPLLAFILAFIFHLILDIIPHEPLELHNWINKNKIKKYVFCVGTDLILLITFLSILYFTHKLNLNLTILAAIIGGLFPDVIWGIDGLIKLKTKIIRDFNQFHVEFLHKIIYTKKYIPVKYVILIQLAIFVLTLCIYLRII